MTFFFKNKDNSLTKVDAPIGLNLLQIAHKNEIDLEGACEMSLACSTCHVILESRQKCQSLERIYEKLPTPKLEEEDLLDLAYGLTETSRLGCQVVVDESFANTVVTLPKATRNFYVDGHKPKPH